MKSARFRVRLQSDVRSELLDVDVRLDDTVWQIKIDIFRQKSLDSSFAPHCFTLYSTHSNGTKRKMLDDMLSIEALLKTVPANSLILARPSKKQRKLVDLAAQQQQQQQQQQHQQQQHQQQQQQQQSVNSSNSGDHGRHRANSSVHSVGESCEQLSQLNSTGTSSSLNMSGGGATASLFDTMRRATRLSEKHSFVVGDGISRGIVGYVAQFCIFPYDGGGAPWSCWARDGSPLSSALLTTLFGFEIFSVKMRLGAVMPELFGAEFSMRASGSRPDRIHVEYVPPAAGAFALVVSLGDADAAAAPSSGGSSADASSPMAQRLSYLCGSPSQLTVIEDGVVGVSLGGSYLQRSARAHFMRLLSLGWHKEVMQIVARFAADRHLDDVIFELGLDVLRELLDTKCTHAAAIDAIDVLLEPSANKQRFLRARGCRAFMSHLLAQNTWPRASRSLCAFVATFAERVAAHSPDCFAQLVGYQCLVVLARHSSSRCRLAAAKSLYALSLDASDQFVRHFGASRGSQSAIAKQIRWMLVRLITTTLNSKCVGYGGGGDVGDEGSSSGGMSSPPMSRSPPPPASANVDLRQRSPSSSPSLSPRRAFNVSSSDDAATAAERAVNDDVLCYALGAVARLASLSSASDMMTAADDGNFVCLLVRCFVELPSHRTDAADALASMFERPAGRTMFGDSVDIGKLYILLVDQLERQRIDDRWAASIGGLLKRKCRAASPTLRGDIHDDDDDDDDDSDSDDDDDAHGSSSSASSMRRTVDLAGSLIDEDMRRAHRDSLSLWRLLWALIRNEAAIYEATVGKDAFRVLRLSTLACRPGCVASMASALCARSVRLQRVAAGAVRLLSSHAHLRDPLYRRHTLSSALVFALSERSADKATVDDIVDALSHLATHLSVHRDHRIAGLSSARRAVARLLDAVVSSEPSRSRAAAHALAMLIRRSDRCKHFATARSDDGTRITLLNALNDIGELCELHRRALPADVEFVKRIDESRRVWKGRWRGQRVAIKRFGPAASAGGGGDGERPFAAQVALLSTVSHRNLVSALGASVGAQHRFVVMKFYARGSLDMLVANRELAVPDLYKVRALRDIADGLAYLHAHGVLPHRVALGDALVASDWSVALANCGDAAVAHSAAACSANIEAFGDVAWQLCHSEPRAPPAAASSSHGATRGGGGRVLSIDLQLSIFVANPALVDLLHDCSTARCDMASVLATLEDMLSGVADGELDQPHNLPAPASFVPPLAVSNEAPPSSPRRAAVATATAAVSSSVSAPPPRVVITASSSSAEHRVDDAPMPAKRRPGQQRLGWHTEVVSSKLRSALSNHDLRAAIDHAAPTWRAGTSRTDRRRSRAIDSFIGSSNVRSRLPGMLLSSPPPSSTLSPPLSRSPSPSSSTSSSPMSSSSSSSWSLSFSFSPLSSPTATVALQQRQHQYDEASSPGGVGGELPLQSRAAKKQRRKARILGRRPNEPSATSPAAQLAFAAASPQQQQQQQRGVHSRRRSSDAVPLGESPLSKHRAATQVKKNGQDRPSSIMN
jgi:Protein tyrosine and serine/threonine kinase